MAKGGNQKLKLIVLLDILSKYTDKDHCISMENILLHLEKHQISAERKSVYEDIHLLQDMGYEIELVRKSGYRLLSRDFELAELKLLVDAVQASKFITEAKSNELIKKLEGLTSVHQAKELQHSVIMRERIKTMNDSVFFNVDTIQLALSQNKQIRFKYFDWNMKKSKVYKEKNGSSFYTVSPQALTWDDENYYMLAYDKNADIIKHFRVDKMDAISVLDVAAEGNSSLKRFDTASYSKKLFGMFGGDVVKVTLRCKASLAGVFIDRFGAGAFITPEEDTFLISIEVAKSPVFLAWLMQFGGDVSVISPIELKEDLCNIAKKVIDANS